MSVATDFLEWLSKASGKGLMRDQKTGRTMRRPSAAEGVAEGPNFGGQYSVKGGEGMVRPSGLAEGPEFGGVYTARGETLANQRAPSTALVPVRPPVAADPNFTMVKPPSTAIAPRNSTDVERFLREADAAAAKSGASAARWGLPVAAGVAGIGAAGLYDDFGRPVGPAQGAAPPQGGHTMLSAADAYRLGMTQRPPQEEEHPAVAAATKAIRNTPLPPPREIPLPPPRPAELQQSMLGKIFNGGNYQSNSRLVSTPTDTAPVNWGDADRSSDFFRASKQLMEERAGGDYAQGGMPTAHEHALHKAMHVIHHLLSRGGRA